MGDLPQRNHTLPHQWWPPAFFGDLETSEVDNAAASCEAYPRQLDLFGPMTGDEMPRADFAEIRRLRPADLFRISAAGVKVAA